MTQEQKPVLLTEAEWRERLAGVPDVEAAIAALDNAGLIGKPVDPLLIEAREIAATYWEGQGDHIGADKYRLGQKDDWVSLTIALAALRRGREIEREAASPLTRERVREACRVAYNGWGIPDDFVSRLHAALTQEGRHVG